MPRRPRPARPFVRVRPFTRGEARHAGLTDAALAAAEFQQLIWGVHVASTVRATIEVRARGALLIAPEGAAVHRRGGPGHLHDA